MARYSARAPVAESRLSYDAARAEVELVSDRNEGPWLASTDSRRSSSSRPPATLGLSDVPVAGPFGSDGKRFMVAQIDPAGGNVPVQVVRNWSAMLARRAR